MTNVISLDAHRGAVPANEGSRLSDGLDDFATPETAETSCIRAAAAMAETCADWSIILLHRPSQQAMALLAEARLLLRDLLVVGGIAPPHAGDMPSPTPQELAARIYQLKKSAVALGALSHPSQ